MKARAVGLIPACAGQTPAPRITARRCRAHPRVCGADIGEPENYEHNPGSSPRVRGRHALPGLVHLLLGLIPACAGQTMPRVCSIPRARAHPRVCGADAFASAASTRPGRLIPACAGQTRSPPASLCNHQAHPRVCGADGCTGDGRRPDLGSSPRVRGRRLPRLVHLWTIGLIPACAGQTYNSKGKSAPVGAHPRVCGADSCRRRTLPT